MADIYMLRDIAYRLYLKEAGVIFDQIKDFNKALNGRIKNASEHIICALFSLISLLHSYRRVIGGFDINKGDLSEIISSLNFII